MTKQEIFEYLSKVLPYFHEDFCDENRDEYIDTPLRRTWLPFEYSIESGITKTVILIKGANFVVKIPFTCWYDEDSFDDELNDWHHQIEELSTIQEKEAFFLNNPEPCCADERWFYEFSGAYCDNLNEEFSGSDYCHLETAIYRQAVEEGLGAYFAEEGTLGDINNTTIYYQTRCTPVSSLNIDYNSQEYEKKNKLSKELCRKLEIDCFHPVWIADFVEHYGAAELKRLHSFLMFYEIGDLRPCNIGYLDGAPILFDYSGYREWD